MEELLRLLFQKSIELNNFENPNSPPISRWVCNSPTTPTKIREEERSLGVSLPMDYKKMLLISNGFKACSDAVEPSFLSLTEINFTSNIRPDLIEVLGETIEFTSIKIGIKRSILIAGKDEEQQFLLIPPSENSEEWQYWKFANWIPGIEKYDSLVDYFESVISFLDETIQSYHQNN